MLKIILVLLAGIALGLGLRKVSFIRHISKSISWTIRGMLILLGIEVGCNETIINNLSSLGLQALLLTVAGVLGSLVAGWAVYQWQFKKDPALNKEDDEDNVKESKGGHSDCYIVVGLFILGLIVGVSGFLDPSLINGKIILYVLYLLMFQVGISLGYDKTLENAAKGIKPNILLIPLATIAGTLAFSALAGLLLSKWSMANKQRIRLLLSILCSYRRIWRGFYRRTTCHRIRNHSTFGQHIQRVIMHRTDSSVC